MKAAVSEPTVAESAGFARALCAWQGTAHRLALTLPLLALGACASAPSQTAASSEAPIDKLAPAPLAAVAPPPAEPLDMLTRLALPRSADTVEKATLYLLEPTGYNLAILCARCPPEAAEIVAKPISPLGRRPQLTSVKRALILVAGSATHLVVDRENKLISFGYDEGSP